MDASTAGTTGAPSQRSLADLALAGCVLGAALALCFPALALLSFLWRDSQFYGHAYAIPLTAGLLAYGNRRAIAKALAPLEPPAWGPPVAFGAALFQVLALMGDVRVAAQLGIPGLLAAAVYAAGGLRLLRPLAVPLAFLALMVPPPGLVKYQILLQLKLLVTHVSVFLLRLGGEPVLAEGNKILIPGHTLFIADACSGLTSIVTMLPLACIVAYFLTSGIWRRALVVASVVPLAMVANIVRVVVTVLLVPVLGPEAAQGSLHESFGLATYVVGTFALVGVARVLR